ncbi:hypothetical protein H4582DRAFT_2051178 [Lactarius indigo]|nr:hypothetical protein H4582DRAFT_2051178 [Lactarius indigo]
MCTPTGAWNLRGGPWNGTEMTVATGFHTWVEFSRAAAAAGRRRGVLMEREITSLRMNGFLERLVNAFKFSNRGSNSVAISVFTRRELLGTQIRQKPLVEEGQTPLSGDICAAKGYIFCRIQGCLGLSLDGGSDSGLTSPILYVLTDFVNINHVLARAADLLSTLISRLKKRETAPSEERAFLERLVDILGETRQRGTAYHYKPAHFRSLGPASQGAGPATLGAIAIVFCPTPRSHRPPAGSCAVLHWLFKFSPWFS